jgi:tetratricopeptide (TPR) repeat protein
LKPADLQATQKAGSPQTLQVVCVCVFLVLAILAVFGQTAGFGFINYDDDKSVYANPVVTKGLSAETAAWAFTHAQTANWIPLTTLSHILDCQLFGLRAEAHHLVNVLWHAASAVLLFLVLRRMTGSLWRAAAVAAVFAIHPLRVESVAWVTERKDVLSGFFFMLTLGAYVRYAEHLKSEISNFKYYYALMLVFFVLGLMSKPMLATLPFVLLLLDYWPLGRLRQPRQFLRLVGEKIPLFALSAAACAVAARVPGQIVPQAHRLPWPERLGNALVSYVVYLRQMVFPAGLAFPYPLAPHGQPMWKVSLALVLLASISTAVFLCRKKRPFLLTGWLWYLGMLVPVIGILQISQDAAHADRYTYLPGIGLALAAIWAAGDLGRRSANPVCRLALGGVMIVLTGACLARARVQTSYWRDSQSLWTHTLALTPGNSTALLNLGEFLRLRGDLDGAIVQYRAALEITPESVEILNNLGNVLGQKGASDQAMAQFQKALRLQPGFADTRVNLGNVLVARGRVEEAIAQYRAALALAPDNVDILNNLGKALSLQGKDDEAIAQYERALQLQPGYATAHFNLGHRFLKLGRLAEAAAQFRQALKINPGDAGACNNLGQALLLQGDAAGAMACFEKTTAMSPDPLERWSSLGSGFLAQQHWDEAKACYRQALELAQARKMDALAASLQKEIQRCETNSLLQDKPR